MRNVLFEVGQEADLRFGDLLDDLLLRHNVSNGIKKSRKEG